MKKLFFLFFFQITSVLPASGQGLHGRILIVPDTSSYVPHDMANIVPALYRGQIDSRSSLPSDLSGYDAVLIQVDDNSDTLSTFDQLALIDYAKSRGKLYIENPSQFLRSSDNPQNPDLFQDTLCHFLGLSIEGEDALVARYSNFYGVDSEFTRGLNVAHDAGIPTDDDLLGSYIPNGNFIPVLYGDFVGGDIFAWIPSDASLRVVVQYHPTFDYGHKTEYYTPFMLRVLCDYFGLCEDVVKAVPSVSSVVSLTVQSDGAETTLICSLDETGTLEVINTLGEVVFQKSVSRGANRISAPKSLSSGVYFARLQSGNSVQSRMFAVF